MATVARRTPRVNVGRENPTKSQEQIHILQERCERLQSENHGLKQERNEQEQLLKDLRTKFRRLTRDLRAGGTDVDKLLEEPMPTKASASYGGKDGQSSLVNKLAQITAQRDRFQSELNEAKKILRLKSLPGSESHNHRVGQQHQYHQQQGPLTAQQILEGQMRGAKGYQGTTPMYEHDPNVSRPTSAMGKSPARGDRSPSRSGGGGNQQQLLSALSELDAVKEQNRELQSRVAYLEAENDRLMQQNAHQGGHNSRPGTGGSIYSGTGGSSPMRLHAAEAHAQGELQRLREKVMDLSVQVDSLTRERDMYRVQAQSSHNDPNYYGSVDPSTMMELQRSITEKTTQLTILNNKFTHAQSQVRTLQGEVDRLVDELRVMHNENADVKRNMFELEHDKFQMQVKCERVDELERTVQLKNEELLKNEQELLKMVDRMHSATRDTEASVRREFTTRQGELEAMREEAESTRKQRERENYSLQQEVAELKRQLEQTKGDHEMYTREIKRLQDEKAELQQRNALLGAKGVDADDDVHKAVAMVGMKKKAEGSIKLNDLWEGMEWNEGWELSKLRDAMAQAALDLELAETRCSQLHESTTSKESLLSEISKERDTLLDENIELRQRISGIQTTFIKQQIENGGKKDGSSPQTASIALCVSKISCDREICKCDDGTTFSPTLFFTLDGLDDYETVVSENFHTIDGNLNVKFRYDEIPVAISTVEAFQRTTFTFQLHQSYGLECDVVAVGSLPASELLRCRDGSVLVTSVNLYDSEGSSIGCIDVSINVANIFIPLLLRQTIVPSGMSAESVRAALLAFRGVRALRIAVRQAKSLLTDPDVPSPYVFYTASSPNAVTSFNFVLDTTVLTQNRAVTADPIFEVTPVDHRVVVDREFVTFVADATITFVVFDHRSDKVEKNLGVAAIPLRSLLKSPTETIVTTEKLHPQGTLDIEMAWVR